MSMHSKCQVTDFVKKKFLKTRAMKNRPDFFSTFEVLQSVKTNKEMKHIGWIGLGNMGTPMASNLAEAGFPLTVFNRSIEKAKPFENTNVKIAQNVTELVTQSDIIFTMLSNDEAVAMVYDEILETEAMED